MIRRRGAIAVADELDALRAQLIADAVNDAVANHRIGGCPIREPAGAGWDDDAIAEFWRQVNEALGGRP